MKDEEYSYYLEAGRVAHRVLARGVREVRIEASIADVVTFIEQQVLEGEGIGLAFPLNLSLNEDAAHDTAMTGDERRFKEGDVVKLDLGVHIEGYIADVATTVDLGDHGPLVNASLAALEEAIRGVKPGVTAGEIGAIIQHTIESRGFRPIANLSGHGLDRYAIHTSPTIPNLAIMGGPVLREGMVFAIEPFATTGSGMVSERNRVEIYQQIAVKPVRLPSAKRIMSLVRERKGLPFSRRWIQGDKLDLALQSLVNIKALHQYPVLHDIPGSLVSQHEHTLIVTGEGCVVTTR